MQSNSNLNFQQSGLSWRNFLIIVGLLLCLSGAFCLLKSFDTFWGLFENQAVVLKLADSIEKQSNINKIVDKFSPIKITNSLPNSSSSASSDSRVSSEIEINIKGLNLAYFFAWALTVIILFTIIQVAISLIVSGVKIIISLKSPKEDLREVLLEILNEKKNYWEVKQE